MKPLREVSERSVRGLRGFFVMSRIATTCGTCIPLREVIVVTVRGDTPYRGGVSTSQPHCDVRGRRFHAPETQTQER